MKKKRIAFVGTGGRALSFIEPLVTTYRDTNELVGLCDLSAVRMVRMDLYLPSYYRMYVIISLFFFLLHISSKSMRTMRTTAGIQGKIERRHADHMRTHADPCGPKREDDRAID